MTNRPARVRQREIESAIRAAKKAGLSVVEVKIGDEALIRIPLVPDEPLSDNASPNSWSDCYVDGEDGLR
jgi:hypothetical protein